VIKEIKGFGDRKYIVEKVWEINLKKKRANYVY